MLLFDKDESKKPSSKRFIDIHPKIPDFIPKLEGHHSDGKHKGPADIWLTRHEHETIHTDVANACRRLGEKTKGFCGDPTTLNLGNRFFSDRETLDDRFQRTTLSLESDSSTTRFSMTHVSVTASADNPLGLSDDLLRLSSQRYEPPAPMNFPFTSGLPEHRPNRLGLPDIRLDQDKDPMIPNTMNLPGWKASLPDTDSSEAQKRVYGYQKPSWMDNQDHRFIGLSRNLTDSHLSSHEPWDSHLKRRGVIQSTTPEQNWMPRQDERPSDYRNILKQLEAEKPDYLSSHEPWDSHLKRKGVIQSTTPQQNWMPRQEGRPSDYKDITKQLLDRLNRDEEDEGHFKNLQDLAQQEPWKGLPRSNSWQANQDHWLGKYSPPPKEMDTPGFAQPTLPKFDITREPVYHDVMRGHRIMDGLFEKEQRRQAELDRDFGGIADFHNRIYKNMIRPEPMGDIHLRNLSSGMKTYTPAEMCERFNIKTGP